MSQKIEAEEVMDFMTAIRKDLEPSKSFNEESLSIHKEQSFT